MVYFSNRKKLNEIYKKWAKENYIPTTTFNCINFLQEFLDEEKVKEFLEKEERN